MKRRIIRTKKCKHFFHRFTVVIHIFRYGHLREIEAIFENAYLSIRGPDLLVQQKISRRSNFGGDFENSCLPTLAVQLVEHRGWSRS